MELVDTPVSGAGVRKDMRVRVSRRVPKHVQMMELVDLPVSKTGAERYAGSIPALHTNMRL